MSSVDHTQVLLRAVDGLRSQGHTTAEIVALIIGEERRTSLAASEPEAVRMVTVVHEQSGASKKLVWTQALQDQLDKEERAKRLREARGRE